MKRIRIREFFKDYDPLRKGFVTETQFKRILHVSNISLTETEIEILVRSYKVDTITNGLLIYN